MPPSAQARPSGLPGGPTTIAIVLVLVIPSVLLIGVCVARRMPWFEPIRQRVRAVTPTFTRQAGAAGPESLRKLPVVKYDEKIFNGDAESGKSSVGEGLGSGHAKQRLRNLAVSFNRIWWSFVWSTNQKRDTHEPPDQARPSAGESGESGAQLTKLAMKSCAICTEDFSQGTKVRKLPCGHIFHVRCIDPWLVNFAATCPLCRIDLSVKEATNRVSKPRTAAARISTPATSSPTLSPPRLSTPTLSPLPPSSPEAPLTSTASVSPLDRDAPFMITVTATPATTTPTV
ncbi:hypothetical protein QBC34DRAFT_493072 [Podospora aff. communis PSN243]|uniref:RING-type E3 ubiquitin transferase n=1 Tax=Podospora aff. communis PSN243 TaxID=3040156 RepID=A0AAV9GSZ2_9PEZI|nr:hypothetical protein QBC34DRAFT_493072 [Podospora aff. communis PSN243]